MARVSCALPAFEVAPSALRACRPHDVASEFMSRLDPSLAGSGCNIEVYRLQKLREEDQLYEGDELLCRFPTWHFDLTSLEELFQEVEDLKSIQAEFQQNYENALSCIALCGEFVGSISETDDAVDTMRNCLLERDKQLAAEKRKHKKLRGDLLAIREQTLHLQQLVLDDAAGLDRLSSASNSHRGALPLNSPGPGHLGSQGVVQACFGRTSFTDLCKPRHCVLLCYLSVKNHGNEGNTDGHGNFWTLVHLFFHLCKDLISTFLGHAMTAS